MKTYKIANYSYKILLFVVLTIIPVLLLKLSNGYSIYYFALLGIVSALAYDLPVYFKRLLTNR